VGLLPTWLIVTGAVPLRRIMLKQDFSAFYVALYTAAAFGLHVVNMKFNKQPGV